MIVVWAGDGDGDMNFVEDKIEEFKRIVEETRLK